MKFKRILLKVSGEALIGDKNYGIDPLQLEQYSNEIKEIKRKGVEIAIVIGGGNIFRGIDAEKSGIERVQGDYRGMLATLINCMALQSQLEKIGCDTRLMSGVNIDQVCEPFIRRRAIRHIEKNRIVIFAAGTGNPFFTTDTAASLRASEMKCDFLLKATKVDGIYDSDPFKNSKAKKFDELSYDDVIRKNLKVMDITAITLAKENKIPIVVFSILQKDSLIEIINGNGSFTTIKG